MTDLNKLAEGTVEDISGKLAGLSDDDLKSLHDIEEAGAGRTTLLSAIDRERDGRGEKSIDKSAKSDSVAFDGEEGLRARNETMTPGRLRAEGQTGTASKAKNG